MSKLAEAIAHEEGFYVPNSLPARDHNPGDLRHSPHSFHTSADPNAIGQIDNDADGWSDLEHQLRLYASRGMTVEQMVYEYAPPTENNSPAYLAYVCKYVGCAPSTLVSDALEMT